MSLDPFSSSPAYRQIADQLRADIEGGDLLPGDRLPSEAELVERYGTAHGTVREAIAVLRAEGLVIARQGRGVFVRSPGLVRRFGSVAHLGQALLGSVGELAWITEMSLDPLSPLPAYRQIADQLRAAIESGELRPGDRLPSEAELVERYGTAHGTVREAIAVLRAEGLVIARQGRGVFVRTPPMVHRFGSADHLRQHGVAAPSGSREHRLLEVGPVAPPAQVAERLRLGADAMALVRRYLLFVDNEPVQLSDSYFDYEKLRGTRLAEAGDIPRSAKRPFPGVVVDPGTHSKLVDAELKATLGISVDHFFDEISVAMTPTPDEARSLRISRRAPVIRLLRTYYDTTGQPFEVGHYTLAADRNILTYEVPIAAWSN
jgi:GntR family transcriptional regulator